MAAVKISTVANSVGVVLPKEIMGKMRVAEGGTLYVPETPDGVELIPVVRTLPGRWIWPRASCAGTATSCESWPSSMDEPQ